MVTISDMKPHILRRSKVSTSVVTVVEGWKVLLEISIDIQ